MLFLDPRTNVWLFVSNANPPLYIMLGYIFISVTGPRIMKSFQAMELRTSLLVYNVAMVILNAHIVYEVGYTCRLYCIIFITYVSSRRVKETYFKVLKLGTGVSYDFAFQMLLIFVFKS